MTLLPIAQRELQVAATKRSTLWVRLVGAATALLIGGFYFWLGTIWSRGAGLGQMVFTVLTSLAFVAAMSAGMFFTSDALSEEKREGTLGLLFLTDLRGYDVVSGKLLAAGFRGFYMLLATLPIAGATLLMGGVTGAAFWRTCLALLNALFVSLAAGLFVSSISREAQRALLATMMFLIFLGGAGFLIDKLTSQHVFRFSSPLFAFTRATRGTSIFWEALMVNQIIAWSLLALGCHFVARTWHDKPDARASKWGRFAHWLKYGDALRRATLRNRLMDLNPITWLTCRERWQAASFWVIMGLLLVPVMAIPFVSSANFRLQLWTGISTTLTLVLYLGIASQSCRFFVDARKSALLEILLSTPMTGERIVQGQWKAAWRMFSAPLILFLTVLLFGAFLVHQSVPTANPFQSLGTSIATPIVVAADLLALTWFGMWMGLTSKNANSAAWKTVLFVQVLPWIALTFASGIMTVLMFAPRLGGLSAAAWTQYIVPAMGTAGSLAIDWWLFRFARRKLSSELAQRAAASR